MIITKNCLKIKKKTIKKFLNYVKRQTVLTENFLLSMPMFVALRTLWINVRIIRVGKQSCSIIFFVNTFSLLQTLQLQISRSYGVQTVLQLEYKKNNRSLLFNTATAKFTAFVALSQHYNEGRLIYWVRLMTIVYFY